jgi:DNA-binding MarR family transcriptional regulator
MGELGAELGVALSSVTRIVDWLSDAGCVERIDDPHDRRIVRVRMTDHGRQLYQVGVNHYKERIAGLLRDFSGDEQAELLRLMTKLLDSMLAADGAGGVTPG